MTKCGESGNKAVYSYKNNFVITRGRQNVTSEIISSELEPRKSFMQQSRHFLIFLICVIRWDVLTTDINVIIIIEMYRKPQNHILQIVLSFCKY